jgi:AcrR family transcriptional regulator/predicted DNA-binding transcriptional regulator AlpA
VRTLSMSELEQVTGVPRGTIYHYIREGLIPPSLETGRRTGFYTEEHARLLTQIRRLRRHRVPVVEIREHLRRSESGQLDDETELATRRDTELRTRILSTAIRRFSEKGYRKTGVDEIIAELEIAPGTLYRFFPTKRDLFIQSIRYLVASPDSRARLDVEPGTDVVTRNLHRADELLKLAASSKDMLVAARAEALGEDDELEHLVERTYAEWLQPMIKDFEAVSKCNPRAPSLAPELVAYALVGSAEAMLSRVSQDDRFSESDAAKVLEFVCRASLAEFGAPRYVDSR